MAKRDTSDLFSATDVANAEALAGLTAGGKKPAKETAKKKPVTEEEVAESLTAKSGDLVAKRRWYCTDRTSGCKGAAPFLGWEQIAHKPTCPNCGKTMRWHQWGERVK